MAPKTTAQKMYCTRHCESAKELLNELEKLVDTSATSADSSVAPDWVFRGERDAAWSLQPTVWRGKFDIKQVWPNFWEQAETYSSTFIKESTSIYRKSVRAQSLPPEELERKLQSHQHALTHSVAELMALCRFSEELNDIGLTVARPVRFSDVQSQISDYTVCHSLNMIRNHLFWPLDQELINGHFAGNLSLQYLLEISCIARHYEFPSRLLDVTSDIRIAAFWAAWSHKQFSVEHKPNSNSCLSILAIDLKSVRNNASHEIGVVEGTRMHNPFMHAQDGLFLFRRFAESYYTIHNKWPDLQEVLPDNNVIKFSLSTDHVDDLLQMISNRRIYLPRLMPYPGKIVEMMNTLWKKPPATIE
ncbi:MAG: FRG domain-containing protein [Phycisphaeraceae bacterium]|nr:FRG domain-containing protein [Phycisphaerales bacterium]MCB9859567.1 FRG domain-containing protein [Phycisphaeraceae bacterium]